MSRKLIIPTLVLIFTFILSACSAVNLPGISSLTTASGNSGLSDKLGVGLLKLEGTQQAVTAEQAAALLPLWQAVKSIQSESTASDSEIQALYAQIQESLTSEQVQAIQSMTFSESEIAALIQQGSSQTAKSQSSSSQTFAQSGGPMGGPGGGGDPMMMGADMSGASASTTPQASSAIQAITNTRDTNYMVADAVIALLQKRIGA
jgi:hypothetical protein